MLLGIIWPSKGRVTTAPALLHADKYMSAEWGVRTHLRLGLLHRALWKLAASHRGRRLGSHAGQTRLPARPLCNCFRTCSDQDGSSTGRGTRTDTLVVTRERYVCTISVSDETNVSINCTPRRISKRVTVIVTRSSDFTTFVDILRSGTEGAHISDVGGFTPKRRAI